MDKNSLITLPEKIATLPLLRDVTKHLKRGHLWIFKDCFDQNSNQKSGIVELIHKKDSLGFGIYQDDTQLSFRLLFLNEDPFYKKNNIPLTFKLWSEHNWKRALALRAHYPNELTNSFRLINGEGDNFAGLTIDIYNSVAVIKHDHPVMEKIWNHERLTEWLRRDLPFLSCVYLKRRNHEEEKGMNLFGELPDEIVFLENGAKFASNIRDAAKTGFFLDQRDNRLMIKNFSKNKDVLNLFSYTAGFSLFAALGGASSTTSVDISKAAIVAAMRNFEVNQIKTPHHAIALDAFEFVDQKLKEKTKYDLVIADPPSFAPNQKAIPQAIEGYTRVFSQALRLVKPGGLFAASSCSSHITYEVFMEICQSAMSKANKRGRVIYLGAQPTDHPYPLMMTELRYLKFILFSIE